MNLKPATLLLLAALLTGGLAFGRELRSGDLLFQTKGQSDFSEAISAATAGEGADDFVHVGILYIPANDSAEYVIEASPSAGVRITALEEFLEGARGSDGRPRVAVKRLDIPFSADETVARALEHLGEPYDWYYLPDNGMMYCSELVYEAYRDSAGAPIFETRPMNFRSADGTMPDFWIRLYNELGVDVPEGIPGTNPNDMARDPRLTEIYRYN